jgi:hypothetical protein
MDARTGQKKQKLKLLIRFNWIMSCDTEESLETPFPLFSGDGMTALRCSKTAIQKVEVVAAFSAIRSRAA